MKHIWKKAGIQIVFGAAWIVAFPILAAQPVNDDFANRISLSGTRITTTGTNVNATREDGEPKMPPDYPQRWRTLWWSWTAPADGLLAISTLGSDFPATVDVFTGITVEELHLVSGCNPSFFGCAGIQVSAGTAYQIVVGGLYDTSGSILLNLAYFGRPPNDNFAARIHLGNGNVSATGTMVAATFESGEEKFPNHVSGSIWWSWTAPINGPVTIGLEASPFNSEASIFGQHPGAPLRLNLFTSDSLGSLVTVTNKESAYFWGVPEQCQVSFEAVAGTTYNIAAAGFQYLFGALTLRVAQTVPPRVLLIQPDNDREFVDGSPVTVAAVALDPDGTVSAVDFTLNDRFSVWTRTLRDEVPPFSGTWTNLPPGEYDLYGRATDDLGATANAIPIRFHVRPVNDDFADRIPFTGTHLPVTGTLANASSELEEPSGMRSANVWWSWTAPESGTFTITAVSAYGYDPTLGVFSGDSLDSLALIASSTFEGFGTSYTTRVVINAEAAGVYPIAIGTSGYGGWYELNVTKTAPPTVAITSPVDEPRFIVGEPVTFTATASDPDGSVSRVDYVLDDYQLLGSATNNPFTLVHTFTEGNFRHRVRAWATDDAGIVTPSELVWFEVHYPGPINDHFADRIAFTGSFVSITGSTANATYEPGEEMELFEGSAWWAWTAPESGDFTITATSLAEYRTSLAVFTGSTLASLVLITNAAYQDGYATRVVLHADAGVTYAIAVGSGNDITLSVARTVPPTVAITSPVAEARVIVGDPVTFTAAASDPDGSVTRVDYMLNDYQLLGSATNSPFTLVHAFTEGNARHRVRAWATDDAGIVTPSELVWFEVHYPGPINDHFADRIAFTGSFGSITGSTANATYEPGEEMELFEGSAWWAWTAPESGDFTITATSLPGYRSSLAVFTGSTLASLVLITNAPYQDPAYSTLVVLHADAGVTYAIAVGSGNDITLSVARTLPPTVAITSPVAEARVIVGEPVTFTAAAADPEGNVSRVDYVLDDYQLLGSATNSPFTLVHTFTEGNFRHRIRAWATDDAGIVTPSELVWFDVDYPPPANDDFNHRIPLTGILVVADVDGRYATGAPEELPSHDGSVWFSWIAPASGEVTLTSSKGNVSFGVYSGTNRTSLTLVVDNGWFEASQVKFNARVGTEYQIACASQSIVQIGLFLDARELRNPRLLEDGLFAFDLHATVERLWTIEASTNLVNWIPLETRQSSNGTIQVLAPAASHPRRFYRAVAEP